MHKFEREIKAVLFFILALAFLMPVIVGRRYLFPFVFPKGIFHIVITEVAFLLYLLLLSIDRKYLPRPNLILAAMLAFFTAMVLATFLGADPGNAFWSKAERMEGLFNYIHFALYAVILAGIMKSEAEWIKMFHLLLFSAVLTGVIALFAKFSPNNLDLGNQSRLASTFGNAAFLSTYFVTLYFIALIFIFRAGTASAKIFYGAAAVFFLFLVILSQTRGAVVGFTAGMSVFFGSLLIADWRRWRKTVGLFFAAGLVLLSLAVIFREPLTEKFKLGHIYQLENLFRARSLVEILSYTRYYSAKMGWEGFLARPIFGWGPENFMYVFNRHFEPEIHTYELSLFDRAHNKIMDILSMYGALGFLAYVFLWGSIILTLFLSLFKKMVNPIWSGGFLGMMSAYFVQNIFLFEMPTSNLIFFFFIGFFIWFLQEMKTVKSGELEKKSAGAQGKIRQAKNSAPKSLRRGLFPSWVLLPATAVIVFSLWVGVWQPAQAARGVVDVSILLSRAEQDPRFFKVALETYRKGRGLDTYINREFDVSMARRLREVYGGNSSVLESESFKTMAAEVMANLQKDFERHPFDYDVLIEKGNLAFMLQSRYPEFSGEARESWEKAKTVSPRREDAYHQLALWYASRAEFASADREMEKLLTEINGKVGRYWWFKTVVDLQGGKPVSVVKEDLAQSLKYKFGWYEPRNGLYVVNYYAKNGKWSEAAEIYELMVRAVPDERWETWSSWAEPLLSYMPQAFAIFQASGNPKRFEELRDYILERVPPAEKERVSQVFSAAEKQVLK